MGSGQAVRAAVARGKVSGLYLLGGIVSLALLIYLVVAMLRPEIF